MSPFRTMRQKWRAFTTGPYAKDNADMLGLLLGFFIPGALLWAAALFLI